MEVQLNERFVKRIAGKVNEMITEEEIDISQLKEQLDIIYELIVIAYSESNAFGNKPTKREIQTIFEEVMKEA